LNILDINVSGFKLDLYKLNRPFLDFFPFFNKTLNLNHSSSGFNAEGQGAGRGGAKEDLMEGRG
jgi:hypothetical protein